MVKQNEKKIKVHEQKVIQSIENISSNIAYKLGFDHVPWFTLTKLVLGIYTILTCFVLFFRTDFINLTVCTAGIYMILNTDKIKKWSFRALVFGIFLSLGYDLVWFLFIQDFNSDQSDGGVEKALKSFSLSISYFSFFFRIIVAMVFWKDSVDFNRIIVKQQDKVDNRGSTTYGSSPDRKRAASKKAADEAISQYKSSQQLGASVNAGASYNQKNTFDNRSTGVNVNANQNQNAQQNNGRPGNGFDMGRR